MPALMRVAGEERLLAASLCVAGATFSVFPFFEGAWALAAAAFVLGLGLGIGQPLSIVMTYNRAPGERIAEALGMRFAVVNFAHLIVPLTFGSIASVLGVAPVFGANAALMFGGAWASRKQPPAQAPIGR